MRAGYGKKLRSFFNTQNPITLIDLGPGIFESATVDTNIMLIQKGKNQYHLSGLTLTSEANDKDLGKFIQNTKSILPTMPDGPWFIGNQSQYRLKEKIEQIGKPLKEWDVNIYRGVLTGLNKAFIIDQKTRDRLIAEDPNSAKILKPILRGRDIKRYSYDWAGLWLIFIPWHFPLHDDPKISGSSNKAEEEFEKQYPAIYKHLVQFKEDLENRNKAETGIRYEWYAMQRCANTYYDEFEKEKVVWSDIATTPIFTLLSSDVLFNNTVYMVISKNNKFFAGVLNSNIIKWYFPLIATDLGGKGKRFFKIFVEIMPIPPITEINQPLVSKIGNLVEKILDLKKQKSDTTALENEIDLLVYQLYDLTPDEIKIIEEEK
jgi:hypothetical protein